MASITGGKWELTNSTTLSYVISETNATTGKVTTTTVAKIAGLANLSLVGDKIMVANSSGVKTELNSDADNLDIDIDFTATTDNDDNVTGYTGQLVLGPAIISQAKLTLSNGKYNGGTANAGLKATNFTLGFKNADSMVHILTTKDGENEVTTEKLVYDAKNGKINVVADLSAGYVLATNNLSATYSGYAGGETLATISGLKKNLADADAAATAELTDEALDTSKTGLVAQFDKTGIITLSKDSAGTTDNSVLDSSAISIAQSTVAKNNGINYYLALKEDSTKSYTSTQSSTEYGEYAQKPVEYYIGTSGGEKAYWTVKGTAATYQVDSPTGYALDKTDGTATKVNVTKAKTTILATVSGLLSGVEVADEGMLSGVDSGEGGKSVGYVDDNGKYTAGLTATVLTAPTYEDGKEIAGTVAKDATTKVPKKGQVGVSIGNSVLPATGTIQVKGGANYNPATARLTGADFPETDTDPITEDIWVINGNTATYKRVQVATYKLDDTNNKVVCTPQKDIATFLTIKGLDEDALDAILSDDDNVDYSTKDTVHKLITSIEGITLSETADSYYAKGTNGKYSTKDSEGNVLAPGTVKITDKTLFGNANITINTSDNYKLVIDDYIVGNVSPTFSDQKWNLSGTTATLKGTIGAGFTVDDTGKKITYTAGGKNQTLATIKGLKSGLKLVANSTTDARQIGSYINNNFTEGIKYNTDSKGGDPVDSLSYETLSGEDGVGVKLKKIPIQISQNVLGTAGVTLTSTFYTLNLNKKSDAGEKLYVNELNDVEGNTEVIDWHGNLGATATLKQGRKAYYELATTGASITYKKPDTPVTIATVKGLNKNITEDDIEIDTTNNKITLKTANAVAGSNITITNGKDADGDAYTYKLALPTGTVTGLTAPVLNNRKWSQSGTTVTFMADVVAGYTVTEDGSAINYTKDGTAKTLATIKGVNSKLDKAPTGEATAATDADEFGGIAFDQAKGTITISKEALNNATISISGDGNYELVMGDDVPSDKEADVTNSWVVSGGTATYKAIKPAYYALNDKKNALNYTGSTDDKYTEEEAEAAGDKNLKGKSKVYATIKGLASDLQVNEDGDAIGRYVYNSTAGKYLFEKYIEIDDKKIIIKNTDALDYKNNVTLDASTIKAGYKVYLDNSIEESARPGLATGSEMAWSVKSGTASYQAVKLEAGYTNTADGTSIKFQAAKDNITVATIKGLNTVITKDNIGAYVTVNGNVFTITGNALTTSDVTLTTDIQNLENPYKFALGTGVTQYSNVSSNNHDGWVISGTTATYGTFVPTHYELNDGVAGANEETDTASDKISYLPLGMRKEIASLEGLKSGLVTIQNDQIRGISFDSSSNEFTVSSDVLKDSPAVGDKLTLTTLDDSSGYTLALGSDVTTPEEVERFTAEGNSTQTTVTIEYKQTAGFVADTSAEKDADENPISVFKFNGEEDKETGLIAKIEGLKPGLQKNSDGGIDGIKVNHNGNTVTLSSNVLNGDAKKLDGEYILALNKDTTDSGYVAAPTSSGYGWKTVDKDGNALPSGSFALYKDITTSGYKIDNESNVKYTSGGNGGNYVATISGLKNLTLTGTSLDDVTIDETNNEIVISKDALNGKNVKITENGDFTLALNDTTGDAGYVAEPSEEDTWSFDRSKGTATFTQTFIEGYAVDDETESDTKGQIVYTAGKTITSTITNLNKATLADSAGLNAYTDATNNSSHLIIGKTYATDKEAITFENGTFTIANAGALANKDIKLTVKSSIGNKETVDLNSYAIELGDSLVNGVVAEKETPIWVKGANDTKATLTQTTGAGYYELATDNKTIKYSSDPTTVTLATVTGLQKGEDFAAGTDPDNTDTYGKIEGLVVGSVPDATKAPSELGTFTASVTADNVGNAIKISGSILNAGKVQLGTNDPYVFVLDNGSEDPVPVSTDTVEAWAVSGTTATKKNVIPAHYAYNSKTTGTGNDAVTIYNTKIIEYTGQKDDSTILTITGLKKGLTAEQIKAGIDLTQIDNSVITFKADVLGTSSITVKGPENKVDYTLLLDSNVVKTETEALEWVGDGSTYTYKKYTKDYYTADNTSATHQIVYHAGKTDKNNVYATITGLKADQVDAVTSAFIDTDNSNPTAGGTITLGDTLLDSKQVKLTTSGDFKLVLDSNLTNKSKISGTTWSTSNTTATLKGTIGAGYAISEDGKTVNYYSANKENQTIATISGIKKGATIADSDVSTGTGTDAGYSIITLNQAQLGTSKVTVKGDFYKLAAGSDAISETEQAQWIKTKGSAKATYTEKTYAGFSATTDGKTLNYNSKTTDVNLITLDGLNKDIEATAVSSPAEGASPTAIAGVTLDTTNKTITLSGDALTSSKVSVGKSDGYTLKLDSTDNYNAKEYGAHLTFDGKGTASVVKGTTESWNESTDGKSIEYNKANEVTIATVSGLSKSLTYTPDTSDPTKNALAGFTLTSDSDDGKSGTIKLDSSAFADTPKKVTLANKSYKDPTDGNASKTGEYAIELVTTGTNSVPAASSTEDGSKWVVSGTTATFKGTKSAGYGFASGKTGTEVVYTAAQDGSVLTTVTGLPKGLTASADGSKVVKVDTDKTTGTTTTKDILTVNDKVVTITTGNINDIVTTATTLKLTGEYTFGSISGADQSSTGVNTINQADIKNGQALLTRNTGKGWDLSDSNKTATFTPSGNTTVMTIKGITKEEFDNSNNYLTNDNTDRTITVKKGALTTGNVTGTMGKNETAYNFVLGTDVNTTMATGDYSTSTVEESTWKEITGWAVSGGTATFKTYDEANYYIKDNGTGKPNSIIYVAPSKGYTYATINGLNKTATKDGIYVDASSGTITLGAAELGTSKVTLAISKANTVKTSTAILDPTTINNKIDAGNTKAAAFNLALDTSASSENSVQASGVANAVWNTDTNATVAKLTGTITKGYTLSTDKKSITYQAEDKDDQVIVTVSGLKKDAQILNSDVTASEQPVNGVTVNTINLRPEQLGTSNITVKGEGYKLALTGAVLETANSISAAEGNWKDQTEWVANSGTFTYKTYDKEHYELDEKETTVKYIKAVDDTKTAGTLHKTYAVVSGLSKTAESSALATPNPSEGGVITLDDNVLNKAKVTLKDGNGGIDNYGYTLALDSSKTTVSSATITAVAVSGTKATWTGTQSKGYLLANDEQSVNYYSKNTAKQTIATVTGLVSGVAKDTLKNKYTSASNTVALTNTDVGSNVTVGGTAAFSFDDTYKNGYITGSSSSDKIAVAGTGVSINAGAGNDYVDFGTATRSATAGNTFVYASGQGNDVIANFDKTYDKINVTGLTYDKITVAAKGNDALVTVNNKNTIRLKGLKDDADALKAVIFDKSNTNLNGTAATANVLADDNFETTPQLSSIVKGSASTYAAEDLVATDATSLTKKDSAVAYSGSSKK